MKTEKGITLVSLTVYIIVMTIVIGIVTMVSHYFYTNTTSVVGSINPLTEYTKFNSFFLEEVNHENIKILDCENNYIVFDNEVQYTFVKENKGIYKDKVKICNMVEECTFTYTIQEGKEVIVVNITMQTMEPQTMNYVLKR